jgi:uncharacterized membrane-anchored protein YjiN (DUF445 family)
MTNTSQSNIRGQLDDRHRRLAKNRMLATGLLASMGCVFVATLFVPEPGFAVLLIRSGAEAGVVGGLADWFAVTALFRHPLGLPIPHTAIIPANQQRIARALGHFVETNFLTRDLILRKIRQIDPAQLLLKWLTAPQTPAVLSGWVVAALPGFISGVGSPDLRRFVDRAIGEQVRRADLASLLGRVMRNVAMTPEADAIIQGLVDSARTWLATNKDHLLELVEKRSRWWMPRALNKRIAAAIAESLAELLEGLRKPDGELRAALRNAIARFSEDLERDPARRERVNAFAADLAAMPEVQAWLNSLGRSMSQSALEDLANPASSTREVLEKAVASFSRGLARDPAMLARLNDFTDRLALILVTKRKDIAGVITEVMRDWDAQTLTDRLELAVGSDLQYIRINGTLVGAAVGCALFLIARLIGVSV